MSGDDQAAVFLDRDGTLIRDVGHLHRADQVEILAGAATGVRLLRDKGFKTVVITNQSAVARGLLSEPELHEIHRLIERLLAADGAILDAIYYCPHHPTEGKGAYRVDCTCRKPNPGLIVRASADLRLDARFSYMVGDQASDLQLAERVGAQGIFLSAAGAGSSPVIGFKVPVFENLEYAAQWIVARTVNVAKGVRR